MAQKLNKKLIFVVGSLVLLVGVGGLGMLAIRWRYDAERHIRNGDQLVSAGDFEKAADAYGRAVNKKPNNLAYLDKLRGAVEKIVPATENEARERYNQQLQIVSLSAKAGRDDVARWRDFLGLVRDQAESGGSSQAWKALAERCDEMQRIVAEKSLGDSVARLYRGYAGLRRSESLTDSERAVVLADLKAAAAEKSLDPEERDLVDAALARFALEELARAKATNRAERIEAAQKVTDEAFAAAEAGSPNGLQTAIARFQRAIIAAGGNKNDPALLEPAKAVADRAMAASRASAVLEATDALLRGGPTGFDQALRLIGGYSKANPGALMHRRAYAQLLRASDREAALAEAEAIMNAPRPTVGLVAAVYEPNRVSAAQLRFDILHELLERSDEAGKAEARKRALAAREDLAKFLQGAADDSTLLRSDGKLKLADGDFAGAALKFNEVFKKGSQVDLELHLLSALANIGLGEDGRALELVNAGLQMSTGNVALLRLKADLEYRAGRMQQAIQSAQAVLAVEPDDELCKQIEAQAKQILAVDPASMNRDDPFVVAISRIQQLAEQRQFDRARAEMTRLRTQYPKDDVRLDRVDVAIEIQAADLDKARVLVANGLKKYPNDLSLVRFNAVLSSEDPVERIVALSEGTEADEKSRTVMTYMRLRTTAEALDREATSAERLGQATAAEKRATAKRVAEGAKEWRAKADQADPLNPMLLETDFLALVDKKDFAGAEAIVAKVRASGRDPAQAPIMQARVLLAQDKLADATRVLEQAIQSGNDASAVYRALGTTLDQAGNIEGAVRQLEEAYKRRPSDMMTVRVLASSLIRAGNPRRALEILREARSLAGLDEEIGDLWIGLEAQVGDRALAQRMRGNRYQMLPGDTGNAMKYAGLLAMSTPDRADIIDANGRVAYTESQWRSLDNAARLQAIDRRRGEWRSEATDIYKDIAKREPGNLDAAASHATLLRALGRNAEAEKALAEAVTAAGDAAGWRGYAMLGQLQVVIGAPDRAQASFAEAIKREDSNREATRTIIGMLMDSERFDAALSYLEPIAKDSTDPATLFKYAEACMRVGRLEEARSRFDAAAKGITRDLGIEMLDGAICVAQGDRARAIGDDANAMAAYEKALPLYQRAKQLGPNIPAGFVQDAMVKRKMFEVTGDKRRLEEALASADRAVAVGAAYFPSCAVRAEVLVAQGDVSGAVAELERYLAILPASVDGRRRLVDLLVRTGRNEQAEAALMAAIGIAPGEPAWHFALGEMLSRAGRLPEAARAFERADTLQPDAPTFYRELEARMRARDFTGVIDSGRRRGDFVRTDNTARTYVGLALIGRGDRTEGMRTVGETYKEARTAADAGDGNPMTGWYTAFRVLLAPQQLAEAEELIKQVSGGNLSPYDRDYLASMAMMTPSAGPAKAVELLAPVETADYSKNPALGSMLLDRLGTAYYMAGDCAKSIACFEQAMKLAPEADGILNNFAYLCGECLKDPKRGMPAARRAVQIQPTRAEYLDTLATLLLADGNPRDALETLDRAAKIQDSGPIQYHRAQALAALGRKEEARAAVTAALGMPGLDPPTKQGLEKLQGELK